MAYTTINKSSDYFQTNLYTANGSGKTISGMNFKPDFIWTKNRDDGNYIPALVDAVRGGTKKLFTNGNTVETTDTNAVTSFTSDGYVFGSSGSFNYGTDDYVNWCLKAGGGQGSSNTDGSINTTYTSVNTTAGFSISSYTGTGSNATVGHGLSSKPSMIIVKNLSTAYEWGVYHKSLGATKNIYLDSSGGAGNATFWNNTEPTSSVFNVGSTDYTNGSGKNYIAYCFAEKTGYSKFGSYTGNGNADGSFCYLGFKPAFVMTKRTDGTGDWFIQDNKRLGYNYANYRLFANTGSAESTASRIDLLSNGFKCRDNDGNGNGFSYIYMAFAEAPLVGSNGVTAKAR